jgi:DNA mismatch endonuclease (patch repair protein)
MDTVTRDKRSAIMAAVPKWNTAPEMTVREALRALGLRFRVHVATLPGRPDVVLTSSRVVFRIHGCFWHGHSCRRGRLPSTNRGFWHAKILNNLARDKRTARQLRRLGWSVFTVWECRLKAMSDDGVLRYIQRAALRSESHPKDRGKYVVPRRRVRG